MHRFIPQLSDICCAAFPPKQKEFHCNIFKIKKQFCLHAYNKGNRTHWFQWILIGTALQFVYKYSRPCRKT